MQKFQQNIENYIIHQIVKAVNLFFRVTKKMKFFRTTKPNAKRVLVRYVK